MYPKTNEWNLLKQQFDALADEESADADSIEEIFDMEFRRRPFHRGHFQRSER
ncbi:MAG: hypothetical protein WAN68_19445 [Pseudolabrys sp.]|jgi:hypothetical protein